MVSPALACSSPSWARSYAPGIASRRDDVSRVGIRLVECTGEQGSRDRPGLDMHPVGESRELLRVLVVERDVQPLHAAKGVTIRVAQGAQRPGAGRVQPVPLASVRPTTLGARGGFVGSIPSPKNAHPGG